MCDGRYSCHNTRLDEKKCPQLKNFDKNKIVSGSVDPDIHYFKTDICNDVCDKPVLYATLVWNESLFIIQFLLHYLIAPSFRRLQ